jgi:hypothetical protein
MIRRDILAAGLPSLAAVPDYCLGLPVIKAVKGLTDSSKGEMKWPER